MPSSTDDLIDAVLDAHVAFEATTLVPEIETAVVTDFIPFWEAMERAVERPIDPPYFVAPWPGSAALARLVIDGRIDVHGRRVFDLGAGSGLAALAVARRGGHATAVDVDPHALTMARRGAQHAQLPIACLHADAFCVALDDVDVVLVGDLASRAVHGSQMKELYRRCHDAGVALFVADSGRPFFTAPAFPVVATFDVDVPLALEGVSHRTVRVFGRELAPRRSS